MDADIHTLTPNTCSMVTASDPMIPTPYRVVATKCENHDTFTITLESVDGPTNFIYKPGQFNMVYVHGVGEVPISISGNPADTRCVVHTTRAVGAATRAMQKLRKGDVVGLRGPFGTSWPVHLARGRDLVVVTGGIGLAPLRPSIYCALHGADAPRQTVLLYGARTPDDLFYTSELKKWAKRPDLHVDITVDRASEGWRGKIGVVTTLIPGAPFTPTDAIAMVCGPEIMMRFSIKSLLARGIPRENIYVSMERNMKCAVGFCGHCQYGSEFICKDGPVFAFDRIERLFTIREL